MAKPIPIQADLFLTPIGEAPSRDLADLMSVPFLSVTKRRRVAPITYRKGDTSVEVSAPTQIGIATVWDWSLVLWVVSQINAAIDRGEEPSPTVRAPAYDLLRGTKRGVSGRDYQDLVEALARLKATTIRTTIQAGNTKRGAIFSYVESVRWTEGQDGRKNAVEVTLPDWMFQAVKDRRVLAVDDRWFDLTSGIEKRLYQIARKQAGNRADGWRWSFDELYDQLALTDARRNAAAKLRQIAKADHLPEYHLQVFTDASGKEAMYAVRRSKLAKDHPGYEAPIPRSPRNPAL